MPTPKLNTSGVLYSDTRIIDGKPVTVEAEGWVKGWLLNTPKRNIILTASHCGATIAPPLNLVRVFKGDGKTTASRKIVAIDTPNYVKLEPNFKDADNDGDGRGEGDLTICRIDKPFPAWAKGYDFATKVREGQPFAIHTRASGVLKGKCHANKQVAWISGYDQQDEIVAGTSGLPWFVLEDNEWRVATHTTRGSWLGGGIWYMHPKLKEGLLSQIARLSNK